MLRHQYCLPSSCPGRCLQLGTVLADLRIPDLCRCRRTRVAVNSYRL